MRLAWKIYVFCYAAFILASIILFLAASSPVSFYFSMLIHMKKIYLAGYLNRFLFIFLEFFSLLPLFLFAFKKRWFTQIFWKGFFILKVTNLIFNNYYEYAFYRNFFSISPRVTASFISIILMIILPAYIALFLYAFRQRKLFPAK